MTAREWTVVDAHNDLLLELAHRRSEEEPFARYWLGKLEAGAVALTVCPIYAGLEHLPEAALRRALEQLSAAHRAVRENPDRAFLVRHREDLDELAERRRVGLMLAMEGAEPFGYDPEMIDIFWLLGTRMVGLTWNRRNPFADGLAENSGAGLSRLGKQLIRRLQQRGVMVDLAHASEPTFWDILEQGDGAFLLNSHSGCQAVLDTPRNLSDAQLRALAERGGVLGVIAHPIAIDPEEPSLGRMIDHIEHAVTVMGIEHVGIGADFNRQIVRSGAVAVPPDVVGGGAELDAAIEDLANPEDYPRLAEALSARGYGEQELEALLSGNMLRFFRSALPTTSRDDRYG